MDANDNSVPAVAQFAQAYAPCDRLVCLAVHFNPVGSWVRQENTRRFTEPFRRGGLRLIVVECAFPDQSFALPKGPGIVRTRSSSVLWQKERLLNLALRNLPAACEFVAWLDADCFFADPDWAVCAADKLETFQVIQPFDRCVRLPEGSESPGSPGDFVRPAFAALYPGNIEPIRRREKWAHGVTGFAWVARRSWVEKHGFYDPCIVGGGDRLMAYAFAGLLDAPDLDRLTPPHREHYGRWARRISDAVRGRIGALRGDLYHRWHGDFKNRRYANRQMILKRSSFDPARDISLAEGGVWEWSSAKAGLHAEVEGYFHSRSEDGQRQRRNPGPA